MGIKEDTKDFNNTGLRGLLRETMKTTDEAFIRILPGGWRGEVVAERPTPGLGPYLHYRRGYAVLEYSNSTASDRRSREFRVEV